MSLQSSLLFHSMAMALLWGISSPTRHNAICMLKPLASYRELVGWAPRASNLTLSQFYFVGFVCALPGVVGSKVLQNLRPKQYQHSNTVTNSKGRKFIFLSGMGSRIDSYCFDY